MVDVFDVAIIGGGINGVGCAADAALRGLSVFLAEQEDIASQTSSSSTKLIHGGLRYLEHLDFSLVKKALNERQTLLNMATHLVQPIALVLPQQSSQRSRWLVRTGLFFYDHLSSNNSLPHSRCIYRHTTPAYFDPLLEHYNQGYLFYDGITDDARLTITNALQAKEQGAVIKPRTTLIKATQCGKEWSLTLRSHNEVPFRIQAKVVINATGPWVQTVNTLFGISSPYTLSLVKGSHIVLPRQYEGQHAYLLQHVDNRIVFVIPYHGHTMVGTTESILSAPPLTPVHINEEEINYLCTLVKAYFRTHVDPKTILHSWSGIRPLIAAHKTMPSALSRDYAYYFTACPAPIISIYGGKLTTYRQLAENVIDTLKPIFPALPSSVTKNTPLPGAQYETMNFTQYQRYARQKYNWLPSALKERYLNQYGTRTEVLLEDCNNIGDLGPLCYPALYQREVDYLKTHEWAQTDEDILWRRTKLGLMKG